MARDPSLSAAVGLLAAVFDCPLAGISFRHEGKIWSGPTVGWPGGWRVADGTLCGTVLTSQGVVSEPAVLQNGAVRDPHLTHESGARSYLGVPLDGAAAVFVADRKPRVWPAHEAALLSRLSGRILELLSRMHAQGVSGAPSIELCEADLTARATPIGTWSLDARTGVLSWSPEVHQIHEVPPDFEPGGLHGAAGFYPGEAGRQILELVERALTLGESYEAELPFVTAKGRSRWVRTIGNCVFEGDRCVGLRGFFQDITDRKANEDRYKLLAEATDDLVKLTDKRGTTLYVSPSVQRKLGWTSEEFGSMPWQDRVHPEDQGTVEQMRQQVQSGIKASARYRAITKSGRMIWLDVRGIPVLSPGGEVAHIVWTSRDVTSQVFLEDWQRDRIGVLEMILSGAPLHEIFNNLAALIETLRPGARASILTTEQRGELLVLRDAAGPSLPTTYRQAVDGIPVGSTVGSCGVAVHERRRVISPDLWNDPNWASVGEAIRELNLRSCWSEPFFAPDGTPLGTFAMYCEAPGQPDSTEIMLISEAAKLCSIALQKQRSDESTRHALADLASAKESLERQSEELLRRNNELAAAIADSERLRRQAELDAVVAQELRKRADDANRAKSDFLANMSHEIRTPMTSILGFADLLTDPAHREESGEEFVRAIHRNAEHLLSVINDILDITKIEAGRISVERIECSPATIVHDVASLMTGRAAEKGISLEFSFDDSVPPVVITDPTRLRQIAINLVGNAIKFTEDGRVRVLLEYQPEPKLHNVGTLLLRVQDTGIGLSPDQLARLFEAFAQADPSTTRKFGGSGLGLAISRRLARLLGGDISATSEVGRGSEFVLRLNCRLSEGVLPVAPDVPETPANYRICGRILLAEDGPDNQRLIVHLLRQAGAEVVTVTNGSLALEQCLDESRAGRAFDLVLMDMQMPVLDGYATTRELRAAGYTRPIVALTANVLTEQRRRAIESGCNDVIEKPIERQRFLSVCREWIAAATTTAKT
ncbi:MAG: ATP-binding protein [Phycisphaerales bacterium]